MTTRWGIIGCGNVTELKSGPGFQEGRRQRIDSGHAMQPRRRIMPGVTACRNGPQTPTN